MCHVLIIEDEPLIQMDIEALLEREGATSFSFADTEAGAVAAARRHLPDFITSDVKLLEGTGPGAVALITKDYGPIPVIFITASPGDCVPCAPPGLVLTKPLDRPAVRRAFHELATREPR
ncbi:response regulator [Sphingomonas koreensis]|nr:response regulator [Sphingomonas koreensis]